MKEKCKRKRRKEKNTSILNILLTKTLLKTHLMFITLNYHISATCHTISKKNLSKLCKEFCNENVNIKLVFTSFKI